MDPGTLAERLVAADPPERERLLAEHPAVNRTRVARALLAVYQAARITDPTRSSQAVACLELLTHLTGEPEIAALTAWASGMQAIQFEGQMERGVALLSDATARFAALDRPLDVAFVQPSRLHGLAMLGRYDEAIAAGVLARATFERHGEQRAAGIVEMNLGAIAFRRGRFQEAERLYRSARARFALVDDHVYLALTDNNLGTVLMEENRFAEARTVFEQTLVRTRDRGLELTSTEVLNNLGWLGLLQGRYDRALDHLERARRSYLDLQMPHLAAQAELEMAEAYLELNLAREAADIAARLAETFAEWGMHAERARAQGCHGRAAALLGRADEARRFLREARDLYAAEGNTLQAAYMGLIEAQLLYAEGYYEAAMAAAQRSEAPLAEARSWGRLLLARWLRGEAARAASRPEAQAVLRATLDDARARELAQTEYRCLTSLGLLEEAAGDLAAAEADFERSVGIIEALRAPLPAEEFRAAYLSDKLTPFSELVRLNLAHGTQAGVMRAFEYVERARSRALVDNLAGVVNVRSHARDPYEAELFDQLARLREELQSYYSRINRLDAPRAPQVTETLYAAVREREARILEIRRRIEQRGGQVPGQAAPFEVAAVQAALGAQAALVEYFSLDGSLLAFIVTDTSVAVTPALGDETEVELAVTNLRRQIDTLRLGGERVQRHMPQLIERTRHHLRNLYDVLLRPLEAQIGARRLVIAPHRALHYLPFHALHDGDQYLVERQTVSYTPSATVLLHCLERPRSAFEQGLLVGVPDEQIPRVRDEVLAIAELLPDATVLLDEAATVAAVSQAVAGRDVLHLACHGQFRPDNPLFSSLRLADGWLTVRDAYDLELSCGLVTLSACETGMSAVAPGEEVLGLARGFFSAGTPTLLVSLWTAHDAATADLMTGVYRGLRTGLTPADALAHAQRQLIQRYPHPYYWSAFAILGRW